MASLNRVFLIGNLTRDPELRHTPNGAAVAQFGLAVNRYYQSQGGERKEDVCFVDISAWGKIAETCSQFLKKGKQVFLEGRLQFDQWQAKDGQKRSRIKVVANRVQFMDRKGVARSEQSGPDAGRADVSEKPGLEICDLPE
jgi:single-strand DNA-binding protein